MRPSRRSCSVTARRPRSSLTGTPGSGGRRSHAAWTASRPGRKCRWWAWMGSRSAGDSPIRRRPSPYACGRTARRPSTRALFRARVGPCGLPSPRVLRRNGDDRVPRPSWRGGPHAGLRGRPLRTRRRAANGRRRGGGARERPRGCAGTDAGVVGRVDARSPHRRQGRDAAAGGPARGASARHGDGQGVRPVVRRRHQARAEDGRLPRPAGEPPAASGGWRGAARPQPLLVRREASPSSPRARGAST